MFVSCLALGVTVLAASNEAGSQPPGKVYRVGLIGVTPVATITSNPAHPVNSGFRRAMRDRGYVEGKNFVLELRSVEGRVERTAEVVSELIRLNVDVLVTISTEMTREARRVSFTLPIVMAGSRDPVGAGFADSLARPGGNVTGLTIDVGEVLEAKRLELLKEGFPTLRRIALLGSKADWEAPGGRRLRAAAESLRLAVFLAETGSTDYAAAFAAIARDRAEAIVIAPNARHYPHRRLIGDFAAKHRLPSMAFSRDFVEAAALMSYGVDFQDLYRHAAIFVDKVLKGTAPGTLPIEQPTKFELVVNLKAAKALGVAISPSVVARADDVIQ